MKDDEPSAPKNWREFVENREWREISKFYLGLRIEEQRELLSTLESHVPIIDGGDGVETFRSSIRSFEAPTQELADAAFLLECLTRHFIELDGDVGSTWEKTPEYARDYAVLVLHENGIGYHGSLASTYVYWSRSGDVVTLRPNVGEALGERFREQLTPNNVMRSVEWQHKYPWRVSRSLVSCWYRSVFGENTEIDHAIRLIHDFELLQFANEGDELLVGSVQQLAFQVGREYEALLKKRHEPDALRGKKVVQAAKDGASSHEAKHAPMRKMRFERMAELVPELGIDNAARQCELDGLGSWQAIKRQWNRFIENRDTPATVLNKK